MASSKEYLEYVLEQLSGLDDVNYRPMMGEYVIYYRGSVIGGVYDDRFLVKPTENAKRVMQEAGAQPRTEIPYPGAKPMLTAEIDNRELTCSIVRAAGEDLSKAKRKPCPDGMVKTGVDAIPPA